MKLPHAGGRPGGRALILARILISAGFFLAANAATASEPLELYKSAQRAVIAGSLEGLAVIRDQLLAGADSTSADSDSSSQYLLAYVTWRICQVLPESEKKPRKKLLKQTQALLDDVVDESPDNAEVLALRGAVIGDRITGGFSGMFLGPKASRNLKQAYELQPDNPRVALLRGISFYFTPSTFGGGIDKATAELQRANLLFAEQPADQPWPNWGRLDTLAWLGLVHVELEQIDEGIAYYEEALRIEPDYAWVQRELLPAATEAAVTQ